MKKLYILVIAMISVSSIFAQGRSRNDYGNNTRWNDRQQPVYNQQNQGYNDRNYSQNDRYSKYDRNYNGQQQQMQERDRRAAIDRVNQDYDQRINQYRNDRSINSYERNRRIAMAQREREQRIGSFGKGLITGGIIALVAGVLMSK